MAEHTTIGDYTFSERCVACPYVTLAINRKLAKFALFGEGMEYASIREFRQALRVEIAEEMIGTDASFGVGSFEDECSGASLHFTEGGKSYEAVCGREITPFNDES